MERKAREKPGKIKENNEKFQKGERNIYFIILFY